jgi:trimethylamine--corrinoid protein Co-methyltransferase
MKTWNSAEVMTPAEVAKIHNQALKILSEIGVYVANDELLDIFAANGAEIDKTKQVAKFPVAWMEKFISESSEEFDDDDTMETSCLFPWKKRSTYSGGIEATAGTYPVFYLNLEGEYVPHTTKTMSDMARLADALPNITRIGVTGVPSDVPTELDTLYMRLVAWKNAKNKLSGCGEVHEPRLIPYILEMGKIMAAYKGEPETRYTFAEVELLSPLRLGSFEAETVLRFWKAGYRAGIGHMQISGASAPATLAGTLTLTVAESLFVCVLYRLLYGWKKLYIQSNASVLDMRVGYFPFARPERGLLILAAGQMARFYKAAAWTSAIGVDSKAIDMEAGLGHSFNSVLAVMAGSIGLECFGNPSAGDANSPILLVIENEYLGAIRRFMKGFEVNDDTLAWDLIKERGIGGSFLDAEHTVEHFRQEHWQPELMTRVPLNDWLVSGKETIEQKAREKVEAIYKDYNPNAIDEATETALMSVIKRAGRDLGITS